ncbi:hypothetical protein GobsT_24860 [Gemmata obscuriglobus]|uniref:Uncharacterized protein n=1 Tax=Gemmata obscuriglobus TaxID=114 RepID=A0A2Z3H2Y9_9BACT|nr:hypothetical protein [Gemmata obscuriglobus]AWM39221.1 hypothetical protein C1280_21025 [Gemmata obscuriglobus]QEG27726.1 hypothetical protein GobsT_24860 [Gemmata obscuriglobus]VTS04978.1 unnamed protein product [Gemmata obscuriglobus UQM 2246]
MFRLLCAALAVGSLVTTARADRIAPYATPVERALRAPVVVVGKVTAIEKEPVSAPLYPGAQKVAHTIAVVKVESNLLGAENLTHLKVGFVRPAAEQGAGVQAGRGLNNPELKEGQEWLFFLVKHADGAFYAVPYMTPPVETKNDGFKDQLAGVKKALAAVADPARALKAEKEQDRYEAAVTIVYTLRTPREGTRGETEQVPLSAEESGPILRALGEGVWAPTPASQSLNGYGAFSMLGLTEKDGWTAPAVAPGADFFATSRQAFVKWLAGPGKDYRIKKLVPKK